MSDVRARFGAALREWRVRQQLTQEELAERSGLSYKFIGEIERGSGNPTLATIELLAEALKIGITDLLSVFDQGRHHPVEYRISKRDMQALREAAASIGALTDQVVPTLYRARRRSKR